MIKNFDSLQKNKFIGLNPRGLCFFLRFNFSPAGGLTLGHTSLASGTADSEADASRLSRLKLEATTMLAGLGSPFFFHSSSAGSRLSPSSIPTDWG